MVDNRTNWQCRVSKNNTVSKPVNVNSYVLTKIKIYCSVLLNGCVMCPYFAHQKFHQSTSLFIVSFGIHVHINQYAVSLVLAVADFGMSLGLLLAQKKTRPPEKSLAHNGFGHVLCFIHYEHTHTRLTALCPGLPGWAGTRKVKPIWILLKQETVSGSDISWAICQSAPCSRQITTPASHHSVFYRPDALPAAQPTASKHWRPIMNSCIMNYDNLRKCVRTYILIQKWTLFQ